MRARSAAAEAALRTDGRHDVGPLGVVLKGMICVGLGFALSLTAAPFAHADDASTPEAANSAPAAAPSQEPPQKAATINPAPAKDEPPAPTTDKPAADPSAAEPATDPSTTEPSPSKDTPSKDTTGAPAEPAPAAAPTDAPSAPGSQPGAIRAADAGDPPQLSLNVIVASDGTASWDADSAPGNDSDAHNGIVRVNDTVTFRANYAVNGTPGTATTLKLRFDKGLEITQIPGFCNTGSSLVPATAGIPTLPVTDTTYTTLNSQVLTCVLGDRTNTAESVSFAAKVLSYVPNAHPLSITSAELSAGYGSGQTITVTDIDDPPTVQASSRLKWDVSKNGMALAEDSYTFWGPGTAVCPWNSTVACLQTNYSLLIGATNSGKGAMPATGDFVITDDLSPSALFPGLAPASVAAINADLAKYGSRLLVNTTGSTLAPASALPASPTATDYQRDVRKSGTATWGGINPGNVSAPGVPATIRISGSDTTLRTFPSTTGSGTVAVPSTTAYAVSLQIQLYTPVATIRDFGSYANGTWTLPTRNAYSGLTTTGLSGATMTIADQPVWNDYRRTNQYVNVSGGFSELFAGEPRAAGNMAPIDFSPGWAIYEGPAGGSMVRSGSIAVAPGQTVISLLRFDGPTFADSSGWTALGCDTWDNAKLQLQAKNYPSGVSAALAQAIPSGGTKAVWTSGLYRNGRWWSSPSDAPAYTVEYSGTGGAGSGANSTCTNAQGPWYSDPASVPGNDPTLAGHGVYTAVSRVRMWTNLPVTSAGQRTFLWASIGLRVAESGLNTGDYLGNWGSVMFDYLGRNQATMLADPALRWSTSSFNQASNGGSPGDRLVVTVGQTRITKTVRKGTTGAFGSGTPDVTSGDTVQFQLAPSLTSPSSAAVNTDVWVEDCLPNALNYADATRTPNLVASSAPADAKLSCPAGTGTYVRWVVQGAAVNAGIDPIVVTTTVSGHANDATYTNLAQTWSPGDASPAALRRSSASVQVANVAGVSLEKQAVNPVVQVNRDGQATNQPLRWTVALYDRLPVAGASMSDPDIIDVLPVQGLNGTHFHGHLSFADATVTAGGSSTRILYTAAASVALDPADATNGAGGATTWCDAPAGGTVISGSGNCPTAADQVTGLRFQRPGAYAHGDTISAEVRMVATGNAAGDTYLNRTYARVVGVRFPVGPIAAGISTTSSAVDGQTWWDLNRNGVRDEVAPAAHVPVTVSGHDDLGNPIDIVSITATDGTFSVPGLRSADGDGYTVSFGKPAAAPRARITGAHAVSATAATDSDPDSTGTLTVALGVGVTQSDVDAGYYADGSLAVRKALRGSGVAFGSSDVFDVSVRCTDPHSGITRQGHLHIDVATQADLTSDALEPIPAGSTCLVTETSSGHADAASAPVTVIIPEASSGDSLVVVTDLRSSYSAGTLTITQQVSAPKKAAAALAGRLFGVHLTCQLTDASGATTTLLDAIVSLADGQRYTVPDATGAAQLFPLGTQCFATETDAAGAGSFRIDHDAIGTAVAVTADAPDQVQELTITALNTFGCTPELCPAAAADQLAYTGTGAVDVALFALVLLILGVGLRRTEPQLVKADHADEPHHQVVRTISQSNAQPTLRRTQRRLRE